MPDRLYGLFKPITTPTGQRRYERVPGTGSYRKAIAVRTFQSHLLSFQGYCLRPVKPGSGESSRSPLTLHAEAGQCLKCFKHLHTECELGDCRCTCRTVTGQ